MNDAEGDLCDETIEKVFRQLLVIHSFGQFLEMNIKIVSHYEYFINTLSITHKRHVDDPFDKKNALKYEALMFKEQFVDPEDLKLDGIVDSNMLGNDLNVTPE
jgi:hypothetical protein